MLRLSDFEKIENKGQTDRRTGCSTYAAPRDGSIVLISITSTTATSRQMCVIIQYSVIVHSARRQMFATEISPQSDVVQIHSNGSCAWFPLFYHVESHCPVDVTWFPFDKQTCELIYELFSHSITDVNMTSLGTNFLLKKNYLVSAEWDLLGTYNCSL